MTEGVLKPFEKRQLDWRLIGGFLLIVALGIGTGWGLAKFQSFRREEEGGVVSTLEEGERVEVGKTYGRADHVFKDTATGVLEKNGIEGEGTHRLIREGGESQTAYLTSSVLDLDLFVGHKVQVWGETFAAQKAGWLMDVGKVKVLE